jgi:hypothetical protein
MSRPRQDKETAQDHVKAKIQDKETAQDHVKAKIQDLGEWAIASHGRILVPQGIWWFQYVNILVLTKKSCARGIASITSF